MNNKQPKALQIIQGWEAIHDLETSEIEQLAWESCTELQRLHTVNQKLASFVSYYATCPCCNQHEECLDGCTFEKDDPNAYDVMQEAREAMK